MSMQQTIILGILSSTIASIVFYLWMVLIKPRFIISDKICKKRTKDDKIAYMIKVANTTHSFITNVSYSLLYCVEGEDGLKDIKIIEPYKPPLTYMNKYSKANTDYAVRITYLIDENQYPLTDASFFMFTFQAYHSFSNAMRIEKRTYRKENVQEGIFETGKSTKILSHK
ncbi:MAG: hypothetical protein EGS42_08110 [Coprococcus eutactus]|nr:hypothetical protein [Coprococcus eutactus]